jgi:PAS domain S-box-containing protein
MEEHRGAGSVEHLQLLARHGRDLIYRYRLRPVPGYDLVSPAVFELTGYRPEEFHADPELGLKLLHPDDRPLLERLLHEGPDAVQQPLLLRVRTRDGRAIWLEQHDVAVHDDDGHLVAVEGIARDVTERKRTEQRLRESQERYRLLVDSLVDYSIFVLDPAGRVVTWNQGAERLRGYTAEEIIGHSFARLFPPQDVAAGKPQALLATARAQGRAEDEGWRIRKDGSRFWANVVLTALLGEDGGLRGFANVARDMTERRRAEQALWRSQAALGRANEVKSEFLALLAHELRTPVSTMLLSADLLRDPRSEPLPQAAVRELGAKMLASGRHLLALLDDLLDLSRMEAGRLDLAPVPTPLGPLLGEVGQAIAPLATDQGLDLDVHADVAACVLADPLRLRQVLLNLLTNAIKFTGAGGRVWVEVGGSEREVMVSVHDTGRGIAPQDLDRIFRPYEKSSAATPGVGLGLAIARRLIELQGGTLRVASNVGAGATFTISLPRAPTASGRPDRPR